MNFLNLKIKDSEGAFFVLFFGTIAIFLFAHLNEPSQKTVTKNTLSPWIPEEYKNISETNCPEGEQINFVQNISSNKLNTKILEENSKTKEALSVYALDVPEGKPIIDKKSDLILPLASMTKVMTAIIALENLDPLKIIKIDEKALEQMGDSGLKALERWKVGDLVKFMLITSSNDIAHILRLETESSVGKDFVKLMNEKAKELNLPKTFFINETGLDENDIIGGSYSTAKEMSILFKHALLNYEKFFEPTRFKEYNLISEDGSEYKVLNTNTEVETIPNILASKTGFTDLAGGNLVFMFEPVENHKVIVVIFGSNKTGRFLEAKKYSTEIVKIISNKK